MPAVLLLAAYAGTGEKLLARRLSEVSLAARLDRLYAQGHPHMLAVMPDVLTPLGGSQYVDSEGIGAYPTWLLGELLPWLDDRFPIPRWGVAGRSSGGLDARSHGDFPAAIRAIHQASSPRRRIDAFWSKEDPSIGEFAALSSCASPPPTAAAPDARRWRSGRAPAPPRRRPRGLALRHRHLLVELA